MRSFRARSNTGMGAAAPLIPARSKARAREGDASAEEMRERNGEVESVGVVATGCEAEVVAFRRPTRRITGKRLRGVHIAPASRDGCPNEQVEAGTDGLRRATRNFGIILKEVVSVS